MKRKTYTQVVIKNVQANDEDLLTGICFDFGASGISENLEFTQEQDNYEPKTKYKRFKDIIVYFEKEFDRQFTHAVQEKFPNVEIVVQEEENKDWLEEWKKGFESFNLSHNYWVVPSWEQAPEGVSNIIKIDPGMAFGTGTHATTQMAAGLLIDLLKEHKIHSLLDVGTGTGILAILADQLGVREVEAIEIDDDARLVGKENLILNKVRNAHILDIQIECINKEYQVVVANIIDGILINIQSYLKRVMSYKGFMVLTGILEEREENFLEKFTLPSGYEVLKRVSKDEWVGLLVGPTL